MRSKYLAALCGWAVLLAASAVAAQETPATTAATIRAEILSIGGEEVGLGVVAVGVSHCENGAAIEVRLDNVPSKEAIDVYVGEGCNVANTRNNTTTVSCRFVGSESIGMRVNDLRVSIDAGDLIESCATEQESTPKIWFLAVNDSMGAEDVGEYALIETLRLDTRAPSAPTGVEGGRGESQIPVEWNTEDTDIDRFVVLIDPSPTSAPGSGVAGSGGADDDGGAATGSGGWNGECGSNVLTPGASLNSIPLSVKRKQINEATASNTQLSSGDIDGTAAAVAVVAIDEAGNESPISELACVEVVPTQGFWEQYQLGQAPVQDGCPCAALGPAHARSAWPVLLALGWLWRSARQRRSA